MRRSGRDRKLVQVGHAGIRRPPRLNSVRLRSQIGDREVPAAGLAAIREAGIEHFGVRIHGTTDYPARLRDANHPVGLLYFQGNWE